MRGYFSHHNDRNRLCSHEHLFERAVLMVGRKHARERKERREKRRNPNDTRGDAAQDIGFRTDTQRHERYNHRKKEDHLSEVRLAAK